MICQKCGGNLKVESTEKYDTVNRRVLVCKLCGWASGTEETFHYLKDHLQAVRLGLGQEP
jgi:transcription elongation factor Elf1